MKPGRTKRSPRDDTARAAADRQAREIERLQRENDRLREQLDEQAKRIADLERQLALRQQNSTTTSKPPSSDGLAGRQRLRGRRVKSRRKAGGQPGHPGHHRELVPLERVDAVVDLVPETCRRCAHRLHAALVRGCGQPYALQTVEPVTYRCGTRRVCQARSSGSERYTRARPHAVAPMNCVPEDSRRRSTCTGRTHAPRARADGTQTPSSTVAVRAPSPS